ncbi:MAG: hypothetical protein IPK33_27625 [Gemmatimonadetes bacterium]|nr:hypothetical protein [Gemmatimonadota bacterium]MBK9406464.1 hypothetical protein [Gemmatimonadota bacterium]MBP9105983.1 hypothetical protein [Gemmatimonadaceae bacterium]
MRCAVTGPAILAPRAFGRHVRVSACAGQNVNGGAVEEALVIRVTPGR